MEKAPSYGQTGPLSQANSGITTSKVMDSISGTMVGSMKEPGKTTRWMEKEFSHGQMAENTQESMQRTRNRDKECSLGQMDVSMTVDGIKESNMDLLSTQGAMVKLKRASGRMEKDYDGLMKRIEENVQDQYLKRKKLLIIESRYNYKLGFT